MIENEEERFLRRRLIQEESCIRSATSPEAELVHRELAKLYSFRLGLYGRPIRPVLHVVA